MGMNYGNVTKTSFQADIKRKQAFYGRCKRRFKVAQTPTERKWLKAEATRVCTELKLCSKKWKTFGFGGFTWITKNYTVTDFNGARSGLKTKTAAYKTGAYKTGAYKTTSRKTAGRKTSARKNSTRSYAKRTTNRPKVRASNRLRSNAARRSYSAW